MGIGGLCLGPASPPPHPKGPSERKENRKKLKKKRIQIGVKRKKGRDSQSPAPSIFNCCELIGIGAPLASVWGPGGWASHFCVQTTMWKLLYVIYEIWLIFGPCAHNYEKYVKLIFFCLRTRTSKRLYLCASKSYMKCVKYPRCAFWGLNCSDKYRKYDILKKKKSKFN